MNYIFSVGNYSKQIATCIDLFCFSVNKYGEESDRVWLGVPQQCLRNYESLSNILTLYLHNIPISYMDRCPPVFTIGSCYAPIPDCEPICIVDYDVVAVKKIEHPDTPKGVIRGLTREFDCFDASIPPSNPFEALAEEEGWAMLNEYFDLPSTPPYFNTGMLWSSGSVLRQLKKKWLDYTEMILSMQPPNIIRNWVAEQVGLSITMAKEDIDGMPIGHRYHQMNHFTLGSLYNHSPMFIHYCWGDMKSDHHKFSSEPSPLNMAGQIVLEWQRSKA